ncbi:hypothetical protein AU476_38010 [Cupriavidus sp. UYMSc13B]|nr:hypothetical protein AU476_38010 [Cupriavidus sp. UYMSc13B]
MPAPACFPIQRLTRRLTDMRLPPDSLAFQMLGAATAVRAVSDGTALPQAIEDAAAQLRLDRVRDAATRGALQDIAYRTMRQFGTARALVTKLVTRRPGAQVDSLLAVALASHCAVPA